MALYPDFRAVWSDSSKNYSVVHKFFVKWVPNGPFWAPNGVKMAHLDPILGHLG